MRTERSKSKRSKRSGNASRLYMPEQGINRRIRRMKSMSTETSKRKRSRRSGNT